VIKLIREQIKKKLAGWVRKGGFFATMGVLKATVFLWSRISTTMVGRNLFANSTCSRMNFSASLLAFRLPLVQGLYWIRFNVNKSSLRIKTLARPVWNRDSDPDLRMTAPEARSVV